MENPTQKILIRDHTPNGSHSGGHVVPTSPAAMARGWRGNLVSNRHILVHGARLLHAEVLAHDDVNLVSDMGVLHHDASEEAERAEEYSKGGAEIPLRSI